jgi:hypothetical protein
VCADERQAAKTRRTGQLVAGCADRLIAVTPHDRHRRTKQVDLHATDVGEYWNALPEEIVETAER